MSPPRPRIDDAERRRRIGRRHRVAPADRADDVEGATAGMVVLHATDPSTIYLSAWARTRRVTVPALATAMYDERSLVKHMAMRRTLFIVRRGDLAMVQAGASARVAESERRRLVRDVEKAGLHADGAAWLDEVTTLVLDSLADGRTATSSQLRDDIPLLAGAVRYGQGRSWGGPVPLAPRVLTQLSASGRIVRATNRGSWTTSRPTWTSMAQWLGSPIPAMDADIARLRLVSRWLETFGPGTEKDITWWLGSTLTDVRRALVDCGAVPVALDGGGTGWVNADDIGPTPDPEPWVALLPGLDPTTMGWVERDWYLGPHVGSLFDRNGNAGPTIWVDGRVVGGWRQDDDGTVVVQPLEAVSRCEFARIEAEATRLTAELGATVVKFRFPSPLFSAR